MSEAAAAGTARSHEAAQVVTDHINGDSFSGGSSGTAAVAGYPNITVPAGFIDGLPVGMDLARLRYEHGRAAFAFLAGI